jgi:hypothetical protein
MPAQGWKPLAFGARQFRSSRQREPFPRYRPALGKDSFGAGTETATDLQDQRSPERVTEAGKWHLHDKN